VKYPQQIISLFSTIAGWSETFPQFKTGSYTTRADGTISYNDFEQELCLFLPVMLPVVLVFRPTTFGFSFKLFELQRLDQDGDGIPSYLEDLNGDGYVRVLATGVLNPDDTDGILIF
jgi:hypothetical protein